MWIICDNTKENSDLLIGLGFKLNEDSLPVGTHPYLDVSTHNKVYLTWDGSKAELEEESLDEYLAALPNNFLTQISLLENLGVPNHEIRQILKESPDVVNS